MALSTHTRVVGEERVTTVAVAVRFTCGHWLFNVALCDGSEGRSGVEGEVVTLKISLVTGVMVRVPEAVAMRTHGVHPASSATSARGGSRESTLPVGAALQKKAVSMRAVRASDWIFMRIA